MPRRHVPRGACSESSSRSEFPQAFAETCGAPARGRGQRRGMPMSTSIPYLDKAMLRLRGLGLVPEKTEEAPIVVLLNRVSDLDNDKVVAIARTLSQASLFNQVVREQVSGMQLSDRYTQVT